MHINAVITFTKSPTRLSCREALTYLPIPHISMFVCYTAERLQLSLLFVLVIRLRYLFDLPRETFAAYKELTTSLGGRDRHLLIG